MSSRASTTTARRRLTAPPEDPEAPRFSTLSTPAVSDSLWFASDFVIGAGMVIIQQSTWKIVVVHDGRDRRWFLPKGRKDVGESIEAAALREGYEESGYRAEFLPLYTPSRAPAPGSLVNSTANTEPIFVGTTYFRPRYRGDYGGEYLTFWYVGCIDADAVRAEGTGMSDEQHYVGHLLTVQEALEKLGGVQAHVVDVAWRLFLQTYDTRSRTTRNQTNSERRDSRQMDSGSHGRPA